MQLVQYTPATVAYMLFGPWLWVFSGPVLSGGSLLVDDAAVTPAGHCQLEAWARAYNPGRELTAVPACNHAGTEYSLGVSDFLDPSSGPLFSLGVKRLWRDVDQATVELGASFGAIWNASDSRANTWYFNFPASFALDAEHRGRVHANLGLLDSSTAGRGPTAGLGIELPCDARSLLLAEVYVQPDHFHLGEMGWRHSLTDTVSIDLLVGHQGSGVGNLWFTTVGISVPLP